MDNSNSSNNNNNMVMNKSTISGNNNNYNIFISTVDPDSNSGSPRHSTESASAFYRVAAQNLREFYGVKSMAASSLEKTMILLHLTPQRLVVLGLAPQRLLETLISPQHAPEYRSRDERALSEGTVVSHENTNLDNTEEEIDEDGGQEEEASDDDANTAAVENTTQEKKEMKPRHPIHAALVAGSVQLRPREAKALLRALNVSPHRFVRLGLVDRKVLLSVHEGRAYHSFPQQRQQRGLGSPYRRVPSIGKPWRGPLHGPPHGPHLRRGHLHYGSWFGGGIGHSSPLPLAQGHPGRHQHFLNRKSGGMHGARMHGPPCSRSCSPMHPGTGCHGPPHIMRDTGIMRHSVSPPHARGGLRSHQHPVLLRILSEEHSIPMPGFGPWNLNDMHHYGRGHGRRTHRRQVPPPHGPFGRHRPFQNHLHGDGEEERDLVTHEQQPRECTRSLDIGCRGRVHRWVGSPSPRCRHGYPVQSKGRRGVRARFPGRFPGARLFGRGARRGRGGDFKYRQQLKTY